VIVSTRQLIGEIVLRPFVDPPGYRYTKSTTENCQFCACECDVGMWATCRKYECRTYLDAVCESFEPRGDRESLPLTPEALKRLNGAWMKYPSRS